MSEGLDLYPFQLEGVEAMYTALTTNRHGSFLLCDEMGLGKTVQTRETIHRLGAKHVLVVSPATCMTNWVGYTVKSYESLINAYKAKDPLIYEREWDCFVMDEVHRIKNSDTIRCQAVGAIISRYRIGLTGTPIVNHGGDLLTVLRYGLRLKDVDWNRFYRDPNCYDCTQLVREVSLGRKKRDLPELAHVLPTRDKGSEDVELEWTDAHHKKVYVAAKRAIVHDSSFLSQIQRLRQLCIHPETYEPCPCLWSTATDPYFHPWLRRKSRFLCLVFTHLKFPRVIRNFLIKLVIEWENTHPIPCMPSPKMMSVYDTCVKERKVVIFCTYRTFFEKLLQPWLESVGIKCALFCGGSKSEQKRAIEAFETDHSIRALLVVKAAGGEGINLQNVCNVCIIMDSHFSSSVDEQAIQRIDRIGQKSAQITVRKLYMKDSIDVALRELQKVKELEVEEWLGKIQPMKKKRRVESEMMIIKKYDTV